MVRRRAFLWNQENFALFHVLIDGVVRVEEVTQRGRVEMPHVVGGDRQMARDTT